MVANMVKNSKKELVVWGASGHAKVVADIVRLQGIFEVTGYLDSMVPKRKGELFFGGAILGGEEQLLLLRQQGIEYLIIGFGNCQARIESANKAVAQGYRLALACHPKSVIAENVLIGEGTVVAAGAVINPDCLIGTNVIVNTSSSIDHECVIEDGVHICPGVHLSGRVRIGQAAWIGTGASVIDGISIGAGSVIGAGAVVINDIPAGVVAYGNPARIRKQFKSHA